VVPANLTPGFTLLILKNREPTGYNRSIKVIIEEDAGYTTLLAVNLPVMLAPLPLTPIDKELATPKPS
jgi:hypothetical protein